MTKITTLKRYLISLTETFSVGLIFFLGAFFPALEETISAGLFPSKEVLTTIACAAGITAIKGMLKYVREKLITNPTNI